LLLLSLGSAPSEPNVANLVDASTKAIDSSRTACCLAKIRDPCGSTDIISAVGRILRIRLLAMPEVILPILRGKGSLTFGIRKARWPSRKSQLT